MRRSPFNRESDHVQAEKSSFTVYQKKKLNYLPWYVKTDMYAKITILKKYKSLW